MRQHNFAFLTKHSFLAVPEALATRPYAVAGVAYDGAVTNRPGARFGPHAIRRASHMLCDGTHPLWDCSPVELLTDYGDLALPNTSLENMRAALEPLALDLARKHHLCWLGGDHSITLSLLRAYRKLHGRPLALIHLIKPHCHVVLPVLTRFEINNENAAYSGSHCPSAQALLASRPGGWLVRRISLSQIKILSTSSSDTWSFRRS